MMNLAQVPGVGAVQAKLTKIHGDLTLTSADYVPSRAVYRLMLTGSDRTGVVELPKELLDDLRDNTASPTSTYSRDLDERLETLLQAVIDRSGLTGYSEPSLKRLLLTFIQQATKNNSSVHKYNTIGRGVIGDFERWTQTTLTSDEKESLIWVWGELLRLRLIAPTGTDLVDPESWVKLTKAGIAAAEAKELNEPTTTVT